MADTSYCSVLQIYVELLSICLLPIRLFFSIHTCIYKLKIYLPFSFVSASVSDISLQHQSEEYYT
jgi:hypothetical protein